MAGFAAAGIVIAGGLLGWFFIPWASDATLKRVRRRSDAWWSDSLQAYGVFKRESLGKEPKSEAPGTEGALGIWRDEACSEALAGRLSCERLDAMQKVGIKVEGLLAYGLEKERLDRYSFYASGKQRALFAISLSLLFAVVALSVPNAIAQGALNTCVLAMTIALVCDLRARTIPPKRALL